MFAHLKLCLATATHDFKWEKIKNICLICQKASTNLVGRNCPNYGQQDEGYIHIDFDRSEKAVLCRSLHILTISCQDYPIFTENTIPLYSSKVSIEGQTGSVFSYKLR